MKKLADRGWLGITWPKAYGGQDGEGVYEFLLNEALAGRGGPQIGKGVGIIGKTLIRVGSDDLKAEFLPKILDAEVEFAVGYSEPDAGSDAASMKLKATRVERDGTSGWILNGQKTWTTSAHFAEWYWVGARTDPDAPKHAGITLFLVPLDDPGITINGIWTMGDERTNDVFFDDVFVPDVHVVGEVNSGFQYISSALDLERFTMFTFSPMRQRLDVLCDYVRDTEIDGEPLKDDPIVRSKIAQLVTQGEVSRLLGLRVVDASVKSETSGGRAADDRVVRLQALRDGVLAPAGERVDGHRRPGRAAAGAHRGSADGGAGRVDVPLHGDRHDRRRRFRDPEEHHRPPRPRPPEELLIGADDRDAGRDHRARSGVGRARGARASRWLADYGATVVKVGPVPKHGSVQIVPPFHSYGGHRGMQRILVDLKADGGRAAFLRLARGGRRRDRELPARRRGVARASTTTRWRR